MKYIRTKEGIFKLDSEKSFYAIRDTSVNNKNCYVSWLWDNWKNYFLIDSLNCMLFSYNSAQSFIADLMKEHLKYQNLVIEINQYYKDCKQADAIEELCDGFFIDNGHPEIDDIDDMFLDFVIFKNNVRYCETYCVGNFTGYGFIKTDKGLIYVAKMNSEGELVLI